MYTAHNCCNCRMKAREFYTTLCTITCSHSVGIAHLTLKSNTVKHCKPKESTSTEKLETTSSAGNNQTDKTKQHNVFIFTPEKNDL